MIIVTDNLRKPESLKIQGVPVFIMEVESCSGTPATAFLYNLLLKYRRLDGFVRYIFNTILIKIDQEWKKYYKNKKIYVKISEVFNIVQTKIIVLNLIELVPRKGQSGPGISVWA